jgi:hypothetical protein
MCAMHQARAGIDVSKRRFTVARTAQGMAMEREVRPCACVRVDAGDAVCAPDVSVCTRSCRRWYQAAWRRRGSSTRTSWRSVFGQLHERAHSPVHGVCVRACASPVHGDARRRRERVGVQGTVSRPHCRHQGACGVCSSSPAFVIAHTRDMCARRSCRPKLPPPNAPTSSRRSLRYSRPYDRRIACRCVRCVGVCVCVCRASHLTFAVCRRGARA